MAKKNFQIVGIEDINKTFRRMGQVPQKHVTSSSRKGMNIVLKDSRQGAPVDEGHLSKGMKLKGERSRYKGKKVYQVIFDPRYNHIFQTKNKEGDINGYYPVSQEYGFFAKNGRYIPGFRFIHHALANNVNLVEQTIVNEIKKKMDAEIRKGRL